MLSKELAQKIYEAEQTALVPPDLKKKGWVYWDLPGWFSNEMWDFLLDTIGHKNYILLAMSSRENAKRGQLIISPEGMANLAKRVTTRKEQTASAPSEDAPSSPQDGS